MAWGLAPGDRVAIFAGTSFEWMVCDFAIWTAGGVTVPIYETSSADQVEWILRDSQTSAVFVATAALADTVASVRDRLTDLRQVWTFDSGDLDTLAASGRGLEPSEVETRRTSRTSASLATIIYTSGTTGRPKGCTITHANLLCQIRNVLAGHNVTELVFNDRSRTLLFIPVAHILARSIQLCAVHNRVHLAHSSDAKQAAALSRTSSRRSSSPCPTSSRRSTTRRNTARHLMARAGSSTWPRPLLATSASRSTTVVRGAS
jgi:long-chain acyl-CoA synthetase